MQFFAVLMKKDFQTFLKSTYFNGKTASSFMVAFKVRYWLLVGGKAEKHLFESHLSLELALYQKVSRRKFSSRQQIVLALLK